MSDEARAGMIPFYVQLEPAEEEKVSRLDGLIAERFMRAGLAVRTCQGIGVGEQRTLNFTDLPLPLGKIMGSVRAADFLSAADHDAVAMIRLNA
jgi:hypothetical protein